MYLNKFTPLKCFMLAFHHVCQMFLFFELKLLIGPISGIVLFEVVYSNKWSTPQEAASWLHEPASMYEVIPSKPISTEEFTAKQL